MRTLTAPVTGSGSVLTLRFFARTDGDGEAYAFDNIVITGFETSEVLGGCCVAGPMGNSCFRSPQASCINLGGTYGGDGSVCSEMFCPAPTGGFAACPASSATKDSHRPTASLPAARGVGVTRRAATSPCARSDHRCLLHPRRCLRGTASSDCALSMTPCSAATARPAAISAARLACCFDGFCYENQTRGSCELRRRLSGRRIDLRDRDGLRARSPTCPSGLTEITRFDFDGNALSAPSRNLSFSQSPLPGNFLPSLARGFESGRSASAPASPSRWSMRL